MTIPQLITLTIAIAALLTSAVSAYEMIRQSKNAVRPAIIVLEKTAEKKHADDGYSLYLCNMGNAVALNLQVLASNIDSVIGDARGRALEANEMMRELASNRRALVATTYGEPVAKRVAAIVQYEDVNGTAYHTVFEKETAGHQLRKGRVSKRQIRRFQGQLARAASAAAPPVEVTPS